VAAVRVAVVTGAAQGIGRRTAAVLAGDGYALALLDLREPAETLAALRGLDADVFAATGGDVSSETDVAALGRAVCERFGRADVLVNNAGISFIAPAEGTTSEQWRRVLEVNLIGPFLLCREVEAPDAGSGLGLDVNGAALAVDGSWHADASWTSLRLRKR
jgi:NAD(P)-dependent dehydrogenase (short-subunit alcohol dehydrogenase family)